MVQLVDKSVNDRVSTLLSNSTKGKNFDVYVKRLLAGVKGFTYVPRCIYFYYVRMDTDGCVRVDHYFYPNGDPADTTTWKPIPYDEVPARIYDLAINAMPRTEHKNPQKLSSYEFQEIPWERRSYIAIFFDETNWQFHRRRGGKPSVAFDPVNGTPNHSFFDAKDIDLQIPKPDGSVSDTRTAIYFVNHVKKDDKGNDFPGPKKEKQRFKFDMWLLARFARSGQFAMSVNIDPGGTNQGPPLEP